MPVSFETLKGWYKDSRDATADWREEAKRLRGFVDGEQWDAEDRALLEKQKRPAVTFNRLGVVVDAICGSEINNRLETAYHPVEIGDAGVSEVMTSVVAWARHRCQADDEESDAFRDLVVCGMGWTHTKPDYDGERPEVLIERVDPDDVTWDHAAKKRNLRDRRYTFRSRVFDAETARELKPGMPLQDMHAAWADRDGATRHERSGQPGRAYEAGQGLAADDKEPEQVTLVEAEWYERESTWRVVTEGRSIEVDQDQLPALRDRLNLVGVPFQERRLGRKRVYKRAILGGQGFVSGPHRMDPQNGGFRYKCMTGKREKKDDGYFWYGVVRAGEDPQKWANKFFSQVLHIINSGALGGVIAEEGALVDPRKAQQQWAQPNSWVIAREGGLERIRERQPPPVPVSIVNMLTFAINSIRECMGVNPELLGQVQREQPGVLEYQRRQAGLNVLAVVFDALSQYREEQGYLMANMCLTHLADGRLVRITGESGAKYAPFVGEEAADYDVRVAEAPSSPDQKQRMWQMIQGVIPHLIKAGLPGEIWAEIVRYSPLPAALADKIAGFLDEQAKQGPGPEQQLAVQQMMAELAETKAQTEERQAGAALDRAKAAELGARVELDAAEAMAGTAQMMIGNGLAAEAGRTGGGKAPSRAR